MVDENPRCHLHPKPKKSCKICQRVYGDTLNQDAAAKAAATKLVPAPAPRASSSKPTFSCSPLLKSQILESSYYRSLLNIESIDVLAEEMQVYADSLEVYQAGSTTSPSVFLCCVYRLFTLEHNGEELQMLLDHAESPVARCAGLLYARFVVRPEQLWEQLEEYILDEMDLGNLKSSQQGMPSTVGAYVENLIMKDKYYGTPLPRVPVLVRRQLEERVAPLPQYRKRTISNKRELRRFRAAGTPVEVCIEGEWKAGEILRLDPSRASRVRVTVELDDSKRTVVSHLGKVILREPASDDEGRRRRSDSPDWTRWRGESDGKMVEALREQAREEAVCGHGKDYAKRVGRFESGLAVRREAGAAESKLIEDDTLAPFNPSKRRKSTDEEEESARHKVWRSDEEREQHRKLQQIYEKYSQGGPQASGGRKADVEGPDVMRLG